MIYLQIENTYIISKIYKDRGEMNRSRLNIVISLVLLLQSICAMYSPVASSQSVRLISNFNRQKSDQGNHSAIKLDEPLPLPIILTMPGQYKSNRPLFQKYSLRKYQLYDTNYLPDLSKISRLDEQLAYNMQPPTGVFQQSSKIVIENYRLLQMKQFKITLINPSERYRFCVQEIFIDSEQITRQQKRPLPFCLNSTTKYPFFFSLYITQHKPLIFKGTVYFIITIYDGVELVDEKIWPKQIIVKVTHNHLRLIPLQIRNCNKDNSIVMIRNPQKWDLSLVIIYKRKLYQLTGQPIDGNIIIPSQKSYKFIIDGKDSKMTIYTKSVVTDVTYPVLYVPIYCIQDLIIDYFNIGILSDDRSLLEFPVTVSSYSNSTIQIQQIMLKSSSQTVELLDLREKNNYYYEIEPNVRHYIIARIVIHSSKSNMQAQRSYFDVTVKYRLKSDINLINNKDRESYETEQDFQLKDYQLRETKTTFHYCQMRSPISVGGKRFIDISKLNDGAVTSVSQNAFPIRNNLNLPINLIRVIYDESKFKLLWLQDRRDYIFPNHQRDQFSLQYIGPRNLPLSPMKYVALLQFNGNLFIPLEIVIYDKTLQCVYDDEQQKPIKCVDLPTIEFGYFDQQPPESEIKKQPESKKLSKDMKQNDQVKQIAMPETKSKRIIIRNWNPEAKNIKVGIEQNSIEKYGFNTTVNIIGPFPQYDVHIRTTGNIHEFYLKGNHYVIVEIQMYPLLNATSGTLPLRILTLQQHITKPIKFKVQNGTIALIPQISRFPSFYKKSIEYLNLVSTYRQPYRIKSITSNLSNLIVYSNNYTEIYENQWVGMALIYEPFLGEWNITEECCSEKKGVERLFKDLKVGGYRPTPVQIRLKTSTQLQSVALVLIDRSSPPLIELPYNHQFSIREKFRKDAQRIDIHLIDDGNMERFEYKLKVKNLFEGFLKGNVMLFDEDLIQRLDQYSQYRKRMSEIVTAYFCLRNDVKVKHNFNPSLIRTLFQLPQLPIEITVQPLTNTSFYINSPLPPRQQVIESFKFSQYFRQTINSGSRMCYRFQTSLFIKNLIETGVINWFSEQFRFQLLSQFIKRQFQQIESLHLTQTQLPSLIHSLHHHKDIHHTKYHLTYDEFYADHYIDREHFCKAERNKDKMTSMFKFCQHINIKMHYFSSQAEIEIKKSLHQRNNDTMNVTKGQSMEGKKDSLKDSRKDTKQQLRKLKKVAEKQINKCFILPPVEKKNPNGGQQDSKNIPKQKGLKNNQLQIGFEIFPVKNRAPIFTFANKKYKSIIENPHLPKERSKVKETQPEIKKNIPSTSVIQESEQPLFLTTPSFYLVLLNNYTSYQLYHQTIQISKPKLKIKNVIINDEVIDKVQYERNYFLDELTFAEKKLLQKQDYKAVSTLPKQLSSRLKKKNCEMQRSRWLPIYIDEKEIKIKTVINDKPLTKNTNSKDLSGAETQEIMLIGTISQEERLNIQYFLKSGQFQKLYVQGEKVFEISNEGQADITYTHIGFQNVQKTCVYKGIQVVLGPCTQELTVEGINNDTNQNIPNKSGSSQNSLGHLPVFKLQPKLPHQLKIRYSIPLLELVAPLKIQKKSPKSINNYQISSTPYNLYVYNQNSYYMQFVVKFKLSTEIEAILMSVAKKNEGQGQSGGFFLSKMWNIPLNIMAVVFICATIIKFRQDEENAQKILLQRSNLDLATVSFSSPSKLPQQNYQKAYRRMKLKNELMNQEIGSRQFNQPSYQIIQPSLYPYVIGTPFSQKSSTQYHPIVTVSQQLLNSIKQEQKNEKILHNYFNESQQSQIIAKNQHQINQNISLTINLDDVEENDNKSNRHNESISQESSFEFDLRNTSQSHDQHLRKDTQSQLQSSSNSDFSQASESQLPDGQQVQVTDEILNESDQVYGFTSESKKKSLNSSHTIQEEQDKKQGYYNVFFTDNPLKKSKQSQNNSPFSWMNENKKRSRLKW